MTSISPLSTLSRLLITGQDRAKYLHNFCTNEIKALPSGQAVEAFFCDVRARVIAHGYVLAFDDRHEFWMLGGDEAAVQQHLKRYIIMEDVAVSSATGDSTASVAIGDTAVATLLKLTTAESSVFNEPLRCADVEILHLDNNTEKAVALSVTWADTAMLWLAGASAGIADADQSQFERLRIRERFPIIDQDMTSDNMAPEAERNGSAVSYVKGCYLGQEPIARLDAMGHVNRALRCVQSSAKPDEFLQVTILTADGSTAGVVTSSASNDNGSIGLALIRSNATQGPLHCVINGQDIAVTIDR
ncbi:MAG TPA: hypothetical protein PLR25_17300 [Planctomycetaceae bacterium]|nr:hypothetical protein [Planctomycetaceae bacterium]